MMNSVDLTPLYRSSIGFDGFASLLNNALTKDSKTISYPPYNIEVCGDNQYAITLAVAGFNQEELDIEVEKGVLTVCGNKAETNKTQYLYHGIANRAFERKFNLADYVEVINADLSNGLLTIELRKEVPDAMKPKSIAINQKDSAIEHKQVDKKALDNDKAA